ncbi:PAAR domain-containing protein [Burkholderia gladioli]|uniref:PAAR domain-containing protein n=1 Tax=Burkholderia gladioli TaxID=28095 RepID=A0AB38U4M2_BURGA|nr:PAAR domain-containing protein [Burkholderia gladioli]ASD83271.1 hypothetical protein CEJ98_30835 [Burkholderia gladioli pv. gladioli]AWY50699.1 hypothetical protein A8H28_05605 [Burkholderia gladioli pv. gladioli]MBU9321817.1 PAAR domain-containing protein [Burkholderia gladioli]MBU9642917.1 PAAR domain-containing protein [Burkholderia gladioli]MCA8170415.1 PAAR domain-containing protein [Burkholderia gladioli]
MRRKIAVAGDALSSGGTISTYKASRCTFDGHQVALIGGEAFCTACRCTGIIAKAGGPYRLFFMGETTLDGDVVRCQCPVPPRIVASLGGDSWCDDQSGSNRMQASPVSTASGTASVENLGYDEQVKVMGHRVEGLPYYIETEDGKTNAGRIGPDGILPRISTGDKPGSYIVYWGDDALAKQHGGR